jgi:serine/threonine-protein kinase RsbW
VTGEYRLFGFSVPDSVDELQDLLQKAAGEHPEVAPEDLMLFETAIVEIVGNVVEHGRPLGKVVWAFRLRVQPDRLEGRLSDDGQAYAGGTWTSAMPDELAEAGRGFALAQATLDEFEYARVDGVNHWTMVRRRR